VARACLRATSDSSAPCVAIRWSKNGINDFPHVADTATQELEGHVHMQAAGLKMLYPLGVCGARVVLHKRGRVLHPLHLLRADVRDEGGLPQME
jgi:hypothetical protein